MQTGAGEACKVEVTPFSSAAILVSLALPDPVFDLFCVLVSFVTVGAWIVTYTQRVACVEVRDGGG